MKREEVERLAWKYQQKADRAFQNYQETGIARYDSERRNNEDLAEALRMAARAADDAHSLVSLRCDLSLLATKARKLKRTALAREDIDGFLNEVIGAARVRDLIGEE